MPRRSVLLASAAALLAPLLGALPAAAAGELTVVQVAVGQNDAALFQGPCGEVGLIDAGEGSADEIRTVLSRLGAGGLTWAATSHYDTDHIGDVVDLGVDVPVVYDRGGGATAKTSRTYEASYAFAEQRVHVALDIGDVVSLCSGEDTVTFTVHSAGTDGTAADELAVSTENDRGLCFLGSTGTSTWPPAATSAAG